uniref:Uncharacterized protein n=1 Tax=Salix viminalis TaxID=40686 RepID=A0A6N2L6F9_SALVM
MALTSESDMNRLSLHQSTPDPIREPQHPLHIILKENGSFKETDQEELTKIQERDVISDLVAMESDAESENDEETTSSE